LEPSENWVEPRAAVEYRWKLWIWNWAKIYVRNWVKPILLYNSIGNTVIFRDLSIWIFQQRQICFDVDQCKLWNTNYQRTHIITKNLTGLKAWDSTVITENDSFIQKYPSYWPHDVSIYLKNKYWVEASTWFTVKTLDNSNNWRIAPWINMITIPETTFNSIMDPETWKVKDIRPEVFLSKVMKDSLVLYINNENWGRCYVDTDIATDSDWDWDKEHDSDVECNKIAKIKYEPNYESSIW
jgi:hypothetical protein